MVPRPATLAAPIAALLLDGLLSLACWIDEALDVFGDDDA